MKNICLTSLFWCITTYVFAGASNHAGLSFLDAFLNRVESTELDQGLAIAFPDGDRGGDKDWWKVPGFCWTESGSYTQPGDDDKVRIDYKDADYNLIRSIDWSNMGVVQKPDTELWLWNDFHTENGDVGRDMRMLKWLNLSGNNLYSVAVDMYGNVNQFESIDISNNPHLKYVRCTRCNHLKNIHIKGCDENDPELEVIFTHSWLKLSQVYAILESGDFIQPDHTIKPYVQYEKQDGMSEIRCTYPVDNVDLSEENEFRGITSTYDFFDKKGTPLTPTVVKPGVFSFDNSFDGKEVFCVIKNGFFAAMPEGLTHLITLRGFVDIEKVIPQGSHVYYADGQLFIQNPGKTMTEIYSVAGQKVLSSTASIIHVYSLHKGYYIAVTKDDTGTVTKTKFIRY